MRCFAGQWLGTCRVALIFGCFLSTLGCTQPNVKGSYPPAPPAFAEGAAVGAVTGAALSGTGIGGIITRGSASVASSALAGGILGAAIGSYFDSEGLVRSLQKQGVTVVMLGDIVEIVIPLDLVFDGGETEVKLEAEPLLTQVVTLMQQYGNVNVSVEVSSDTVGPTLSRLSLSRLQAQSVTTFLWAHGINLQRMDFQGLGSQVDVADPNTITGSGFNRRIEITFWQQDAPSPYRNFFYQETEDCWRLDNPEDCQRPIFLRSS